MKTCLSLVALLTVLLVAACGPDNGAHALADPARQDSLRAPLIGPPVERLAAVYPSYAATREHPEPFPYLSVHDSADALLGYMTTTDYARTTSDGFVGPIAVRVFLNGDGTMVDYDIVYEVETPGYLKLIAGSDLRDRLRDYRAGQEEPVDAVTLATSSALAIINGITGVVDRFAVEVLGEPDPDSSPR